MQPKTPSNILHMFTNTVASSNGHYEFPYEKEFGGQYLANSAYPLFHPNPTSPL